MFRSICLLGAFAVMLAVSAAAQRQPSTAARALEQFEAAGSLAEEERASAARALGRFGSAEVTQALLDALAVATHESYIQALTDALGTVRRDGVVDTLSALLQAPGSPSMLRSSAARGLGRQGAEGVEQLRRAATLPGSDATASVTRSYAMMGLSQARTDNAWRAIAAIARDGGVNERRNALRYLEQAPASYEVTEALVAGLSEPDVSMAATCARLLAERGHPAAADALLELSDRVDDRMSRTARSDILRGMAAVFAPRFYEPFLVLGSAGDSTTRKIVDDLVPTLAEDAEFVAWLRDVLPRRKTVGEKSLAIRVLGHVTGEDITLEIVAFVRAREPELVFTALQVLGRRGDLVAVGELRKLLRSKDEARRLDTIQCLHELLKGHQSWHDELTGILKGATSARETGVRALALDLLADLQAFDALPVVWRDFDHRDWTVRAAAFDFCRRVRDVDSVPKLIARLDEESGRLREDVLDALQGLTALRFSQQRRWEKWWKTEGADFVLVPADALAKRKRPRASGGDTTSYYGIPLVSERVVFIVDVSGSMSARVGTDAARTRLDEARRQLRRVVEATPKHFRFNIVSFHTTVSAVFAKMSPAATRPRADALAAIQRLKPTGGTNVYDALERAFAETEVDTIYLLSDGSPTAGKITDPNALADEIARWNRTRRIRIHCIAIGTDSVLLKRLAAESGGVYAMFR